MPELSRFCPGCGKPLVQNKRERDFDFKRRKYCGRACFFKDQNDRWHDDIKKRRKPMER